MMCDIFTLLIYGLLINLTLSIMLVSRKWLQTYFDKELPKAEELVDLFNAHAFEVEGLEEVGNDWVIDVDVLPNRSSDCLSHRGIARELATILSTPLKSDPFRESLPQWDTTDAVSVEIEDKKLCPRYMAGVVRGVEIGPSPEWLKTSLEAIGQKSINNVVDATNYIMFSLGKPIHAFDLELLTSDADGKKKINVRLAKDEEEITTLTGESYVLSTKDQLIVDGVSDEPLALAGIKGGKQAEVTQGTTDIVVEVANFAPVTVRKTSNAIKLHTDASLRYQNEIPVQLPGFAMREVLKLITSVAKGTIVGVVDGYEHVVENMPIDVTLTEINSLLGLELTKEDVENILVRFEWEFSLDGEEFAVTSPWERTDLTIKQGVIEEIGRMYGYANVVSKLPEVLEEKPPVNKSLYLSELVQSFLANRGYSEVLTYTIVDKGEVELANPFASDKSFMRAYLTPGMLQALELNTQNAPLLGLDAVKLFEAGVVFTDKGEVLHLAVGVRALVGKQGKLENSMKEDVSELLKSLSIDMKVSVQDGVVEIPLEKALATLEIPSTYNEGHRWDAEARFEMWSTYPCVLRDIAIWVPAEVKPEEVLSVIVGKATGLLVRHDKFDEFEKDGKVSYAWHLVFQSKEKTLTDVEIGDIMEDVTKSLNRKKGWEVR